MNGEVGTSQEIIQTMVADLFQRPIMENNLRGLFAEYLVAHCLGPEWSVRLGSWNPWDLDGPNGEKIEVKSSSYLQTWSVQTTNTQTGRPPAPSFDIAERRRGGLHSATRAADAYVFALHSERDPSHADHRDLHQWQFYAIATHHLPLGQKRISPGSLSRLTSPIQAGDLKSEVINALTGKPT